MNQFAKPGLAEEKLPPVSAADNDKACTVVDGVWKAKTPSSGGGVLVVNYGDGGTLDKTAGEIMTAFENGVVVVKVEPLEGIKALSVLTFARKNADGYSFFTYNETEFAADTADDYPQVVE